MCGRGERGMWKGNGGGVCVWRGDVICGDEIGEGCVCVCGGDSNPAHCCLGKVILPLMAARADPSHGL